MNPFKVPLLPVKGVLRLGQVIEEEAEREMSDPARVRRELEETESRQASGEISEDEAAEMEEKTVAQYTRVRRRPAAAADEDEG
jgi:hypothetical protein